MSAFVFQRTSKVCKNTWSVTLLSIGNINIWDIFWYSKGFGILWSNFWLIWNTIFLRWLLTYDVNICKNLNLLRLFIVTIIAIKFYIYWFFNFFRFQVLLRHVKVWAVKPCDMAVMCTRGASMWTEPYVTSQGVNDFFFNFFLLSSSSSFNIFTFFNITFINTKKKIDFLLGNNNHQHHHHQLITKPPTPSTTITIDDSRRW